MALLILLLAGIGACHTPEVVSVKAVKEKPFARTYEFPEVHIRGNKAAADSINNYLLSDFLEISMPEVRESIFENVWGNKEDAIVPLSDISYQVLSNSNKVLSLSISADGCGAYCEYFTRYYSFDKITGALIKTADLFNSGGVQLLLKKNNEIRRFKIDSTLSVTADSLRTALAATDTSNAEYFREMITLYQDCLSMEDDRTDYYHECYLTNDSFVIITGRCSAHVNRNADELGEFIIPFALKEWQPYLSAYGKKLILP